MTVQVLTAGGTAGTAKTANIPESAPAPAAKTAGETAGKPYVYRPEPAPYFPERVRVSARHSRKKGFGSVILAQVILTLLIGGALWGFSAAGGTEAQEHIARITELFL